MKNIYRFSPITSPEGIDEAYSYITTELERLSLLLFGKKLPITILKIFAHYLDEYDYLYKQISQKGNPAPFNSKTSYYAEFPTKIAGYEITHVGLRIADPYRLHVGCGDYEIPDFADFKKKYLGTSPFIREFNSEMLEVWHPDFDILGYIIPQP